MASVKVETMRGSLSAVALAALGLVRSDRIGAVVQVRDLAVMTELRKAGVVGENDGLTIVGSGLVGELQEAALKAMFE